MEQSPSPPLCNTKVHYCVHKNPPLISIMGQMHPVYRLAHSFYKIHATTTKEGAVVPLLN
jgi:hypothetical protein